MKNELREVVRENRLLIPEKSRIYVVNDTTVGKSYAKGDDACNEYGIGTLLFVEGVSVPEMYQIVPPDSAPDTSCRTPLNSWYVLMERVNGVNPSILRGEELRESIRQYKAELEKALEFGLYPADYHESAFYTQVLFDQDREKLVLLDFESWVREGSPEEINEFRYWLNVFTQIPNRQ